MGKLSRKRALEITRDLWDWLAKNPNCRKNDWVGWIWNGGKIGAIYNDCPCCEYIKYKDGGCIELCPLRNLWKNGCMVPTSAFQRWCSVKTERTKHKYAKQIADACRKELSKYKR